MKKFSLFIILIVISLSSYSQIVCGHKTHPISKSDMQQIIANSNSKAISGVVTIPVVIHIMHRGEPVGTSVNISDAQAASVINGLNRDFRASSADGGIAQRGPSALNADCQIQFCLAKTDPSGNPTNGITRHNCSSIGSFSTNGVGAFGGPGATPAQIAAVSQWDVMSYLNIWVVPEFSNQNQDNPANNGAGFGGFAPIPPNASTTPAQIQSGLGYAGFFSTAILFCDDPNNTMPGAFKVGNTPVARVATHEIGHYFGLPHTFSDGNPTNCTNGDGIADTPNAIQGFAVGNNNICSGTTPCPGQHKENYMDYANFSCNGAFTPGQKSVMRGVLGGGFISLTQGNKCDAAYDLSIDDATITKNDCDLTFGASMDISRNGTQNLTNAVLRYQINGGAFVSIPWPGNLTNSNPTRTINLTGLSGINGANTFYVELRDVNNNLNGSQKDQEIGNDAQTKTFTMTQPTPVSVSASSSSICAGESVSLTASGSSSYSWNQSLGSGASKTDSPTSTRNYIVTGTTSGCVTTDNVSVTVNSNPTASIGSIVQETCQNSNGSLTVTPSGGQSPYQYSLNNGAFSNGANITNLGAGTNTIRVRDGNGCISNSVSTTITNTGGFATSISNDTEICVGESTTIVLTAPSSGMTYTWNNSLPSNTQHSVTPTSTTTYSVVITDGVCIKNESATITVNQLPSVSANASDIAICNGDNLTLTGSGASTYIWDNSVSNGVSFVPTSTTTYSVTGTDVNGCSKASNVTVTVNDLPTVTANSTSSSICIGDNITLTGGGASTYVWNNGVSNGTSFSPAATTTYNVTGTDINGCVNTSSIVITVNQLPTVTASTTEDTVCSGSGVKLTGGGASTYTWSNGVQNGVTFFPTAAASYTVTGTNANGCVNTATISLESLPSPTVTMSLSEVTLCKDATVDVSASGASSYSWITNDQTPNVTLTYPETFDSLSVYGIDAQGRCSTYYAIPFNQSNMELSITPDFSLCEGDQAPIAVSNLGGVGLQYEWNNGLSNTNSHSISPSVPTTYEVIVTDVYGCDDTLSTSINIIESPNLTLSTNSIVFCAGDQESVVVSGADQYIWDTGDTLSTMLLEYPLGVESIVVTGINGGLCQDSKMINIQESFMNNSITDSTAICLDDELELNVQTNDPSVTFSWDNSLPSVSTHYLMPTTTTTYNVTLTDGLGCTESLVTEVIVVPLPQLTLSLNEIVLCDGDEVTVTVTGADEYSWNTGDTTESLMVSFPTGLDSLTVFGINGGACLSKIGIPIKQGVIDAAITSNQRICEGGSVSLLVVSNNTTLDYNWNQGLSNANFHSVSPITTTTYEVELEDALGCKDTLSTMVEVDVETNLTVTPTSLQLCSGDQATLTASGADEFNWSSGGTIATEIITATSTTTINLVGINGACSQSLSIPVQVEPLPIAMISSDVTSVNTGEAIQFYNTGSTANNYEWDFADGSPNSTFANPYHTFNIPGAYIVQLTGFRGGCEDIDSLLVYVGTVGLNENEENSLSIYPNPTEGIINFMVENEIDNYEISIYNNIGSLVYEQEEISRFNDKINIDFLPNGVYYLKATSVNDSKVFKLQIVH